MAGSGFIFFSSRFPGGMEYMWWAHTPAVEFLRKQALDKSQPLSSAVAMNKDGLCQSMLPVRPWVAESVANTRKQKGHFSSVGLALVTLVGAEIIWRHNHMLVLLLLPHLWQVQADGTDGSCITFVLHDEDHTLGNSLRYMIMKK